MKKHRIKKIGNRWVIQERKGLFSWDYAETDYKYKEAKFEVINYLLGTGKIKTVPVTVTMIMWYRTKAEALNGMAKILFGDKA